MVQDASTDVILLFIEGIRDVDKFLVAARRAAEIGKPVIVTKVGRSGAGERAAASHTASMAGWSAAYDAVFAKYGFIVSNDLDEAVTIAAVLTTNPLPKGDRVAVLTVSGGAGIWGADTVVDAGSAGAGTVAGRSRRRSEMLLPSYGAAGNPIDVTAQGVQSAAACRRASTCSTYPDEVDAILVVLSLSSDTRMPFKQAELKPVIDAQNKPIVFYSYTLPSAFRAHASSRRRAPSCCQGLTHVGVAMRRMVELREIQAGAAGRYGGVMPPRDLSAHLQSATLSEFDSKSLLRDAGIALPDEVLVTRRDELDAAIARVGFPLVMKIQSRDIPHKSEVGGVRVNIATKGEAFAGLSGAARKRAAAPARCRDPGRAGRSDGEKGRRDHRRHSAGRDVRPDDHGRSRRHHHGIVPGRDLSARRRSARRRPPRCWPS